jgi:hypothetical protein
VAKPVGLEGEGEGCELVIITSQKQYKNITGKIHLAYTCATRGGWGWGGGLVMVYSGTGGGG